MTFNPLEHPVCLDFPLLVGETAWAEHIPFGMFLVGALRPRILVELGTHRGASYCAFCQAVKTVGADTKCYAVDSWQGDAHAGLFGAEILERLRTHHDPLYADFSRLIQSTFDEALEHFADGSVDLLHIDGFHTYEAVRHDFETWQPKMSGRGIVLLHDTNVREREFGVWKFWDEIKAEFPHFEFPHGHGLGVLAVGESGAPAELQNLFAADENETLAVRRFFHALGEHIDFAWRFRLQTEQLRKLEKYEGIVEGSRAMRIYRLLRGEDDPAKQ